MELIELQPAAKKSPRSVCAVAIYRVRKKSLLDRARQSVAALIECINTPSNKSESCDILVAIDPRLIDRSDCGGRQFEEPELFPLTVGKTHLKADQHDVLIQVGAMTRADCWFGLRLAKALLHSTCVLIEEVQGGHLLLGQETFGFYHTEPQMSARSSLERRQAKLNELNACARIHEGDLAGGSWLMYQRYVQDLDAFYDLPLDERVQVMGGQFTRQSEQQQLIEMQSAGENAHVKCMKGAKMIRRGFSFRHEGEEGTVFLALSNDVESGLKAGLSRFLSQDHLARFTRSVANALYFVPPSGRWLCPDTVVPPLPAEAEALLLRSHPGEEPLALREYTTALAIPEYIALLKDFIFADSIGSQRLIPAIQTLVTAAHQVAAGGLLSVEPQVSPSQDQTIRQELDDLLYKALDKLNQYNGVAGAYVSGA